MTKTWGIARYELMMAWRRGSLPILSVLLLVMMIGFGLVTAENNRQSQFYIDPVMQAAVARGLNLEFVNTTLTMMRMLELAILAFGIALTLFVTEVIPLDRQFKIRELLDTLPISRVNYLGGKLLGIWSGLTLMVLVVAGVSMAALRLIVGAYDLQVMGLLWLVMALPFCWMASGISLLVMAFVGSRRVALMLGLLLVPALLLSASTVVELMHVGGLIEPVYVTAVTLTTPDGEPPTQIVANVSATLALMACITAGVWTMVWGIERWREAR